MPKCYLDSCDREGKSLGLCFTHYGRKRKHGEDFDKSPIRYWVVKDFDDGTRECTKCFRIKPLNEFHNSNTGKGGEKNKVTRCKSCDSEYKKKRRIENIANIKKKSADMHRIRYAAKKSSSANISINLDDVIDLRGLNCMYCGIETENIPTPRGKFNRRRSSLEHIQPLSKGGLHTMNNLGVACLTCNISKGNKTYVQYFNFLLSRAAN